MSQIDTLPPLSEVIRHHQLNAKKSLGQNFILDLNIAAKIAKTAGVLRGYHVIEVGPGPGGLTRAILANGASHLTVIERDQRCVTALNEIASAYPDQLTIIEADALKIDYSALMGPSMPRRVIANLPYNIATTLLVRWLSSIEWPPFYESLTLMFQKEVAYRIVAKPKEPDFGRLSVLAGWRCHANIMFNLDPQIFTPSPKVTSSVVDLTPVKDPLPCSIQKLQRVTAAAFQHRRKMLRSSLKTLFDQPTEVLEKLDIDPTARAETLTIDAFIALANAI